MHHATKRKRGGQKGNQNARKHGFYSRSLSASEICEFLNITNLQGTDREIGVLLIKLKGVLETSPGNRRVLTEAAKLLVNCYGARYRLNREEKDFLRNILWIIWGNLPALSEQDRENFLQNEFMPVLDGILLKNESCVF